MNSAHISALMSVWWIPAGGINRTIIISLGNLFAGFARLTNNHPNLIDFNLNLPKARLGIGLNEIAGFNHYRGLLSSDSSL